MLKMAALACLALTLVTLPICAQNPDQPAGRRAAPGAMMGTVTSFDPGKSIDVEVNGRSYKFDLSKSDTLYNINPEVKPGSNVTIIETTDNSGRKAVTIDLAPARKG